MTKKQQKVQTDQYVEQIKAFNSLKSYENTNNIYLTTLINFDDLYENFKYERYESTSFPIHAFAIFQRTNVKGVIKGDILAKFQQQNIFKGSRLFDQKQNSKNGKGSTDQQKLAQQQQQQQQQETTGNQPQLVYAYIHSKEVEIEFNKYVQLDHFHYRINQNHRKQFIEAQKAQNNESQSINDEPVYYLRTYDGSRIIHDIILENDMSSWMKITFPRSKVNINKIVISQGVEMDNISLNYYLRIKEKLTFQILQAIPGFNLQPDIKNSVARASISDIKLGFEEYEHVGYTLEFIGDMVYIYQIEKYLIEYLSNKGGISPITNKNTLDQLTSTVVEGLKYLEHLGITILYNMKNNPYQNENFEINMHVAISQKLLNQEEVEDVAKTLAKFQKTSMM
ncbi:UNKNOWN [Stylonychia lemnae]|uniref:Uncharacterized protein n=1 Tax=Stylonychia lemnae TaxID=5949 RepID=A0A078AC28_STYLE|nr:UNKNOWN [Stylonychia lemnae]|eukprot:CDW79157.1 UNKNOWN [Stylonychia lemnae]